MLINSPIATKTKHYPLRLRGNYDSHFLLTNMIEAVDDHISGTRSIHYPKQQLKQFVSDPSYKNDCDVLLLSLYISDSNFDGIFEYSPSCNPFQLH